MAIADFGYCK